MPSPRKRATPKVKVPAEACVPSPQLPANITIVPLYAGAQTHVWRVCDRDGRVLLSDLAPSNAEAVDRATAASNKMASANDAVPTQE